MAKDRSEASGESQRRIGKAQASLSRGGSFGLSRADRLKLGQASAKNLLEGTAAKNRAKKRKAKKTSAKKHVARTTPYLPVD